MFGAHRTAGRWVAMAASGRLGAPKSAPGSCVVRAKDGAALGACGGRRDGPAVAGSCFRLTLAGQYRADRRSPR